MKSEQSVFHESFFDDLVEGESNFLGEVCRIIMACSVHSGSLTKNLAI